MSVGEAVLSPVVACVSVEPGDGCVVPLSDSCVKTRGGGSKFIEDSMLSLIGSAGAEICVKPSGGWSKFIEHSMLSLIGMFSLIGSGGAEILDI